MDALGPSDSFLFGNFRLDRAGLFRREDAEIFVPVKIGSRALDILKILIARAGELVPKDEIVAEVWPETVVEDSNLTVQISALRHVLDQAPVQGSCIRTVAGRGYRFVASVTTAAAAAPTLPDKPSIAVLPFQNLSGDPNQEYFVDGMVEEIVTALSRIRWLFVIDRNSSFTYKRHTIDVKQVGRELGVRYVLEGSVRRSGNRVRITGQLVDAETSAHLWADHFDGSLEDVFELQDQVATSVAGVIEPELQAAEAARSARRPTNDLTAYDLYLRAYAMVVSPARRLPEGLRLLEQAIAHDPNYGPALAWAANCCFGAIVDGRSEDAAADRVKGIDLAKRALKIDAGDPGILANAAQAMAYFGEDIGAMMALVDRALALNPSFARGWHISGNLRLYAGQPEIAIEHIQVALRLSPRAAVGPSLAIMGSAHFLALRFDEAIPKLLLAMQANHSNSYRVLAACYAHLGRLNEAREIIKRLLEITPVVVPSIVPYRNPEHRELFLSGLRLAMGGED